MGGQFQQPLRLGMHGHISVEPNTEAYKPQGQSDTYPQDTMKLRAEPGCSDLSACLRKVTSSIQLRGWSVPGALWTPTHTSSSPSQKIAQ